MNEIEKSTKSEYDSLKSNKINGPIERWNKRCNEQIAKKGLSILKREEKESANNPISTCKIKSIIIIFLLCYLLRHTYTHKHIHTQTYNLHCQMVLAVKVFKHFNSEITITLNIIFQRTEKK